MPVTVTGDSLTQYIENLKARFNSPDLIQELGQALSSNLVEAFTSSGLASRSGATIAALSKVSEPEKTSTGWKIGVGDTDALGNENDSAPRGTLRAFYNFIQGGLESTGGFHKFTNWQRMSQANKDLLEQGRRAGMFGGRGPMYANYMWIQNKGNPRAGITGRGFIETGVAAFQAQAPEIIDQWWSSLSLLQRGQRIISGFFGR